MSGSADGLRISGLTVYAQRHGRRATLVSDVALSVAPGETVGLVGESGSGKSLTARAAIGLLPGEVGAAGEVRLDGTDMLGSPARVLRGLRGRRIAMVMQDPFTMLNPLLPARVHVAESLRSATGGRSAAQAEVLRRLAEVGIAPEAAERFPFQLSGGMRQRVAIAAALAGDPEVLIADEPTTALDVTTQAEILRLLQSLSADRGMALILITHDLRVAFSVCDRVLVMYAGSVVEAGRAVELAARPRHPYTRALLASEPPADRYVARLEFVAGNVPAADSVAGQCPFAARCEWAQERCTAAAPALRELDDGRHVACVRAEELDLAVTARPSGTEARASARSPREAPSALLRVAGAAKTYRTRAVVGRGRETTALRGVDLEIPAGASVGLVGESGSGKTTMARAILGLTSLSAGRIELDGIDVTSYERLAGGERRAVRRKVQAVFQDPYSSLNPARSIDATLREAISVGAGSSGSQRTVAELLALVGLPEGYAARRPAALSGGERQRVAIARSIAVGPELLICDEPVAALDVSVQAQVLELLRDLRRRLGMAMLFITHDLAVVRQMTETIVVLYRGEVVETGDTETVLTEPAHEYTRRLLEAIPRAEPSARRPPTHTEVR